MNIQKIKSMYYHLREWYYNKKIKNKTVTIISNNCWGGFMYQSCKLPYSSPFIGLYLYAPDYIKLLRNLKYNLSQPIHFISREQSKYVQYLKHDYIIGVLGETDIEIVFMHYKNQQEIIEKWNRRLKRVNYNNMIVKFSDTDECRSDLLIQEFDKLPYKNKVCFSAKEFPNCDSVIYMPEFHDKGFVLYEWAYSYKYYNFIKEANKITAAKVH